MWHDDIDGVWDDETQRYYYPEYVTPDTDGMPTAVTFTGRHGEKVKGRPVDRPDWKHPAQDKNRAKKKDVLPESAMEIARECDRIKAFLVDKNLAYGNSALEPVRIFSTASTVEQLLVRIDDKLSRMENQQVLDEEGNLITTSEDTTLDLLGYLILLRIAVKRESK